MDTSNSSKQNTAWWISSLAISVVCCAVLFVIFASYLVDVKENMATTKMRFDTLDQRINLMSTEMENLYRRTSVQQIQVIPSSTPVQLPVSVMPAVTPSTQPAAAPVPAPSPVPVPVPVPAKP